MPCREGVVLGLRLCRQTVGTRSLRPCPLRLRAPRTRNMLAIDPTCRASTSLGVVVLSRGQVVLSSSLSASRSTLFLLRSRRARLPTALERSASLRVLRKTDRRHWSWPLIRTVRTLLVPRPSRGLSWAMRMVKASSRNLIVSIVSREKRTALKTERFARGLPRSRGPWPRTRELSSPRPP